MTEPDAGTPGWGKIAANLSILPDGSRSALLTYECRTTTIDLDSRRQFFAEALSSPVVSELPHAR